MLKWRTESKFGFQALLKVGTVNVSISVSSLDTLLP